MDAPLGWNTQSNARLEVKTRDYKDTLAAQIGSEIEARVNTYIAAGQDDLFGLGRAVLDLPHIRSLLEYAIKRIEPH